MKVKITVPEVIEIFNAIQKKPEALFEMIRLDLQQTVGEYLSAIMHAEMTQLLGREPYERATGVPNHRNGSYQRKKALKGIGEVAVKVPLFFRIVAAFFSKFYSNSKAFILASTGGSLQHWQYQGSR